MKAQVIGVLGMFTFRGIIIALLIELLPSISFASFEDELQTQIFKYATDNSPTFYLSNYSVFQTDNFLTKVDTYFESGSKGAWSIDPDPVRYHLWLDSDKKDFIWFGREHPLNMTRSQPVDPRTALGSVWAQNQLDALNPHVSGWVGTGLVAKLDPKWTLVLAYSPLFIPTFGPSLGFTERGDLNPSRFARLPPQDVTTGGVTVPIRYQLKVGQLSQLLLQHQAFMGIAHQDQDIEMDAYVYTAPKPDPVPLTGATLAVNSTTNTVNADVDIVPQFPRQYFMGGRMQIKSLVFQPAFEALQDLKDLTAHYVSVTGYFDSPQLNPFIVKRTTRASFGLLSHLQKQFDSPQFSDFLVFIKLPIDLTEELCLKTLLEATLLSMRQSGYWLNELEYQVKKGFSVLVALRILVGQDNSYFGDWRDQDSYSMGVKWVW